MPDHPETIVSASELGEFLRPNTSGRRVQQLAREGVLPKRGRGRYPLVACLQAWAEYWHMAAHDRNPDPETPIELARRRKLEAEAKSKELDLMVRLGELIPMDELESLFRESLEAVASDLRSVPRKVAPRLAREAGMTVKAAHRLLEAAIEDAKAILRGEP